MDPAKTTQNAEFLWRRLLEECPTEAVLAPVVFALAILGLVVLFKQERKATTLIIGLVVIGILSAIYLPLALLLKPIFNWIVVLVPVLGIALFYVGMMYIRDARSIHPLWAMFLASCRVTVYGILALVFLLPGCQTFEESTTFSKVAMLGDVSLSMDTVDEIPEPGQDPSKLPSRQDKVVRFLTNAADAKGDKRTPFLAAMLDKTPVTLYRGGAILDETEVLHWNDAKTINAEKIGTFLHPDPKKVVVPPNTPEAKRASLRTQMQDHIEMLRSGTNYGGTLTQAMKLETNSYLQAVIVVGDGQYNTGSSDAVRQFLARVNNPKRPIAVFTIGVGNFQLPASIRIDDLQAPETTRPDDKFPVRVPVVGQGLNGEEFTVTVDVQRIKNAAGEPVQGEPKFSLEPRKGTFKGAGDNPQGLVEYDVDVQALKKINAADDKKGELEGTWRFIARVPRNPREAFPKEEHASEPVDVVVQKKKLRVLLFAGGPTNEYKLLRTLLYREQLQKRLELTVFLQSAGRESHVDQDVEKERLLDQFPDKLGLDDGKHLSLSEYDVIVAIDPDWTQLNPSQLRLLKEWVGTHAGGVIFVAGPVHSFLLARPAGRDISSLLSIYPVVLKDSRLHGLGLPNAGLGHDTTRPYALHFAAPATLKNYDFMKLTETGDDPAAGWSDFFWGKGNKAPEAGKDIRPRNGFFDFYPVEKIRPATVVLATFAGPKESRINDGKDEQPWIAFMPYGSGKSIYLSSGELWRLRRLKTAFHERFWIKLARFAAAGSTQQKKYGRLLMSARYAAGTIPIEAQVKGRDLLALPPDARPTVYVRRLDAQDDKEKKAVTIDLKAKPGSGDDWQGWFTGSVVLKEPGDYEFKVPITGTPESLVRKVTIRKPNPELDNVRTNFEHLTMLASKADTVLARLSPDVRKEVERALQGQSGEPRLFFPIEKADVIAKCLTRVPPRTESVKGPMFDIWDKGLFGTIGDSHDPSSYPHVNALWLALGVPILVGFLGGAILLFFRQFLIAALFAGVGVFLSLCVGVFALVTWGSVVWLDVPIDFSFVLIACVSLLGVEWLTRKLLRLA